MRGRKRTTRMGVVEGVGGRRNRLVIFVNGRGDSERASVRGDVARECGGVRNIAGLLNPFYTVRSVYCTVA